MRESFETRRDRLHDAILSGNVGCRFAKDAAEQNEIMYCALPQKVREAQIPRELIARFVEFSGAQGKNVLIGLPEDGDISDFDDCDRYACTLFPELVSSMRFANQDILRRLMSSCDILDESEELTAVFQSDPASEREEIFEFWRAHYPILRTCAPKSGIYSPWLLRESNQKLESVYAFEMDSAYAPVTDIPHLRKSPHLAIVMNYWDDLQRVMSDPKLNGVRRWEQQAVGYPFAQAYRMAQEPHVANAVED